MDEKDFKKFGIWGIIIVLAILSFLIIKPLFTPIVIGLVLAYVFYPLYEKINTKVKSKNLAAWIVLLINVLVVLVPIIILTPMVTKQIIEVYISIRNADLPTSFRAIFPFLFASPNMAAEVTAALNNLSNSLSTLVLSVFQETLRNIPEILFGIVILLFTFFFSLTEGSKLKQQITVIFPFQKKHQEKFFSRFSQVTNSVIYGHVVVGIVQGIIAGVGYYILGLPNALLMTVLTTIAGVLPVIGPVVVWVPMDILLFISGDTEAGLMLLIYGLFVISPIDTILRPYVVSEKGEMNSALALIGMIGGTYAFGITGFLLGPLILAALILLIELYQDKDVDESIVLKEPDIVQEQKK